ncbi:MAG: 9-cis-epoxycarotenoid dioxygenase [Rhodospirillaceae bacterium]|nr:carotenoid oxygenase family protein [Rhodospirillaceae bacterium]MXW90907.1 9-cis-epoxycarotenoid dioxygenase [Rhodospirillaceae bacterium]MYB12601.1 9-cis-epoxycarotenoid dioxygenase [Rhodospirillaceae bacterium]MYG53959.1 9-cis-epoxycarotenoid dioxygenase [Rhodospirillaceae bacterium]MYI50568.1 9-cis-epoxycarotenoid dioxygenase [Rhodospirillaceae bacterium]
MDVKIDDLNPYLQGLYAPVDTEIAAHDLEIEGEIPVDLFGGYYRNGPNPVRPPSGMHHWFDGDAMLHAVWFEDGRATYRNRYVRTSDHLAEVAGACDAGGILGPANRGRTGTEYKDTANTDIVIHNGELMALWYICGAPVRVDALTLETLGEETFSGKLPRRVSAHAKTDARTGEFLFFDYALYEPWMSFGVVGADNELKHFTQIELPGPRLPHDMGITENYAILHDLPVVFTEQGMKQGLWTIHQPRDLPTRFGVLPRTGRGDEIRWFETDPCYIYHVINCWEDGDEVVMHACKMIPNNLAPDPKYGAYAPMVALLALHAVPVEWRMNLKTGGIAERQLDDRLGEFPAVNLDWVGRKGRHSYHVSLEGSDTLLFDGLLKYDLETGACVEHRFAPGVYGSEPVFAPRPGAAEEDDGYVVTFTVDRADGRSEAQVFDARALDAGPVARVRIPQRVPFGFHATWGRGDRVGSPLHARAG